MLRKTKNFLKANGVYYEKEQVNPLMVPERVYVLKFGIDEKTMNNRFIVEYTYTWTGRIKINKISLRLHGQQQRITLLEQSHIVIGVHHLEPLVQ